MVNTAGFNARLNQAAEYIQKNLSKPFWVFHHNDTDGLTSGAIVKKALDRVGVKPRGYCLEKPYPSLLEFIFTQQIDPGSVCIFADFGSGMLPTLSAINKGRSQIIVLDHHAVTPTDDPCIVLVNCRDFGISGTRECSASGVCCALALTVDPENRDLSPWGLLGALGDSQVAEEGGVCGLNHDLFRLAEGEGLATREAGEYLLGSARHQATQLSRQIDALGSLGYFTGGPDIAMKGLLDGFDQRYQHAAETLLLDFSAKKEAFFRDVKLSKSGQVEWFILGEEFAGYGVKTVGLLCAEFVASGRIAPDTYLAGFQRVPDTIPGIGAFPLNQVKISMRVPAALRKRIDKGEMPGLDELLPMATRQVGGFVDACHPHAAATTIAPGKEAELVRCLDEGVRR